MPIPAEFHKRDADAARNFGGIHCHGPREAARHTSPTRRGAEWHSNQTPKQARSAVLMLSGQGCAQPLRGPQRKHSQAPSVPYPKSRAQRKLSCTPPLILCDATISLCIATWCFHRVAALLGRFLPRLGPPSLLGGLFFAAGPGRAHSAAILAACSDPGSICRKRSAISTKSRASVLNPELGVKLRSSM